MQGIITALITPFYEGRVDEKSLLNLLKQQLKAGVQAFVINGTTGESPTLTQAEVEQVFCFVRAHTPEGTKLILGAGLNSTQKTLAFMQAMAGLKPDAWLSVVPYYNKPPQFGLVEHFKALARGTDRNIILYNVPGRTIVGLDGDSILKLSQEPNIVGIKEASGDIGVLRELQPQTPQNFNWLSGDDGSCMQFIAAGGGGVISVLSHIIPGPLLQMFKVLSKDRSENRAPDKLQMERGRVLKEYKKYEALNNLLGIEANPIPVKMALYLMKIIRSPELRLPLVPLQAKYTEQLKALLKDL